MSYDKYLKYKNKYLQLKAKHLQMGGGLVWKILNLEQHGLPATTQITEKKMNFLLKKQGT